MELLERYPVVEQVTMAPSIYADILDHLYDGLPNEACGIVAGRNDLVEEFYPTRSCCEYPHLYQIDPRDQFETMLKIEAKGLSMIGTVHSHINVQAYPSVVDVMDAHWPNLIYFIVSLAHHDIKGYRIVDRIIIPQKMIIA